MTPDEIDAWLASSLEDRRFSRNERQGLVGLTSELGTADRQKFLLRAFELARSALANPADSDRLDWLEGVVMALRGDRSTTESVAEAHFSPGEDCLRAIRGLVGSARSRLDVCVFTITDDRVAEALLEAHRRGVAMRIITDDSKAEDLGSDVRHLAESGIAVRVDRSPFHMHHKFAVADTRILLTGSYNWTRGAASDNEENLIITDEVRLVAPFLAAFKNLWEKLG